MRSAALLGAVLLAGAAYAQAPAPEPVGAALDRPALPVLAPARAVLLAAARAGTRLVAVGERGIVVLSDDGGVSWRQAPVPTSVTLTALGFADARHGFAVGHGGTVLATDDGGARWVRRLDGRGIAAAALQAARASGDTRALRAAERLQADGPDKPLLDLLVFDTRRLLVVGAYGLALASEDGGATWQSWSERLDNPKELHLYALRRQGERIVLAGEQGLLLQSLDGGRSFQRLKTPYAGSFFTVELPSAQAIVVAGLRGNAWRSDDGGTQWTQLAAPVPATVTASAVLAGGRVLLANQAGQLLRAGTALQALPGPALPPLNGLLPLADGRVLALSMQGVHLAATAPGKAGQ